MKSKTIKNYKFEAIHLILRHHLRSIHRSFSGLDVGEYIPIPGASTLEEYQHLLDLEEVGETSYIPRGLKQRVSVSQLLNSIDTPQERQQQKFDAALQAMLESPDAQGLRHLTPNQLVNLKHTYTQNLADIEHKIAKHSIHTPTYLLNEQRDTIGKIELIDHFIDNQR